MRSEIDPLPCVPPLESGEIHVWRINLDVDDRLADSMMLSDDERERARRFHFDNDRNRYVTARLSLRKILAGYLDISPGDIRFSYNQYGKPMLDRHKHGKAVRFNVSHSASVALIAVTRDREIGIDVEHVNNKLATMEAAASFFSPDEISVLNGLPVELKTAAFFSGWTRKEACLKAMGMGLSYPAQQLTVSMIPVGTEESMTIDNLSKVRGWSLFTLAYDQDYTAALAVEGTIKKISYRRWPVNGNGDLSELGLSE